MKSFSFRLEQALRWRTVQADLARERLAAATHRVKTIEVSIGQRNAEISEAAVQVAREESNGGSLTLWGNFAERARRQIGELENGRGAAETELAQQASGFAEAGRRLKLLENLRSRDRERWSASLNRELETFADEAYLVRLQLKKRTGA